MMQSHRASEVPSTVRHLSLRSSLVGSIKAASGAEWGGPGAGSLSTVGRPSPRLKKPSGETSLLVRAYAGTRYSRMSQEEVRPQHSVYVDNSLGPTSCGAVGIVLLSCGDSTATSGWRARLASLPS
jgi:hypothetical protein